MTCLQWHTPRSSMSSEWQETGGEEGMGQSMTWESWGESTVTSTTHLRNQPILNVTFQTETNSVPKVPKQAASGQAQPKGPALWQASPCVVLEHSSCVLETQSPRPLSVTYWDRTTPGAASGPCVVTSLPMDSCEPAGWELLSSPLWKQNYEVTEEKEAQLGVRRFRWHPGGLQPWGAAIHPATCWGQHRKDIFLYFLIVLKKEKACSTVGASLWIQHPCFQYYNLVKLEGGTQDEEGWVSVRYIWEHT